MKTELNRHKRKLLKDKYIAALMNISKTTLISYKNSEKYQFRYKAYLTYYNNMIDQLSEDDIIIYSNDLKFFDEELKSFNILNKFTIL